jgi:3-oxoadipate enol-lactonase
MGQLVLAVVAALLLVAQSRDAAAPLQTSRLAVEGGEIVYDVAGSGPTVVFLHGAFMDRRAWDGQMAAFAKQFRVVRYDIRPFGESSQPDKAYKPYDDLLRLLDHLKVDRAHLVGHSFGGTVALDFALVYPQRVASLVMAAAGPSGLVAPEEERKLVGAIFAAVKEGDDAIVKAWLDHPMWVAAKTRPELRKELEASIRRNLAPFRMTSPPYVPLAPPAIERLSEVRVPTIAILGDRDMPSIKRAAELIAKQVLGATVKIIPGADHALPLGWADEFNAAAIGFISAARR